MLTAHQPNYMPYPGFFQKIAAADSYLLVDTTQFVKRGSFGWIHRNQIRTQNGPQWLSLPVLTKGKRFQRICDCELNPREEWRRKHFRAIEFNYRCAPHWDRYRDRLEAIYEEEWTHLSPLSTALIRWFLEELQLDDRPFHVASELAAEGRSTEYIVAFCQELGAASFLSGTHGRDYLDLEQFDQANIALKFHDYAPPSYSVDPKWETADDTNYSMLDMLLWCGDEAIEWVHRVPEVQSR